jgi:hypothetical protein
VRGLAVFVAMLVAAPARAAGGPSRARLDDAGLTVSSSCARVDEEALARHVLIELGGRPVRPRAVLALSCDDAGPRFELSRGADAPPLSRAFRWSVDDPARWLALAIAQTLVDAGVIAPRVPVVVAAPPAIASSPPAPARTFVVADAGWRWLSLGDGWNGPQVGVEIGRVRGAWALSVRASGCFGEPRRALGRVQVALAQLDAGVAARAWSGGRASLWLLGAAGVAGVQASGEADAVDVVTHRVRGAAPAIGVGGRLGVTAGPVAFGVALRAGVLAGAPAAYVSDAPAVRTSGVFATASLDVGGGP